eukprot:3925012-Prymnesium_polylepis.1
MSRESAANQPRRCANQPRICANWGTGPRSERTRPDGIGSTAVRYALKPYTGDRSGALQTKKGRKPQGSAREN